MIAVRLKKAMEDYKIAKGLGNFTHRDLSNLSGIPYDTVQAIGNRKVYGTTFYTLDKLCRALNTTPADILHFDASKPHPKGATPGKSRPSARKKTGTQEKPKPKSKSKTAKKTR